MSKSVFIDFRSLKAAVSFAQILQHYGVLDTLKGSGDARRGACPIHKGESQSQFSVNLAKGVWNCFSDCKCGGNHLEFVAKMENVDVHAAALLVCEWFKLNPSDFRGEDPSRRHVEPFPPERRRSVSAPIAAPAPPEPEAAPPPNKVLGFTLKDLNPAHPYLTERGITVETATEFGVGFFPAKGGLMVGRIAIPITNAEGKVVAFAGRWPGEPPADTPKYKLPPGFRKSLELFNLDRAKRESPELPWIIVVGFFDALKLHQLGHRKVVALMGDTMSPAQEELLRRHTDWRSHVLVMLSENEAGRANRGEIAARLARFSYVGIHAFEQPGQQPEHLSAEQLQAVLGGVA